MDKLIQFFSNIDWIFLAVILIGGRYWGSKFFTINKNKALNFLAFATVFGGIWLMISYLTGTLSRDQAANLFLTYLFGTSFYELLGKLIFQKIEAFFGVKPATYDAPPPGGGPGGDRPPDPPVKP